MIKACLFDLDGTLADVKDLHYEALNEALFLYGYQTISYEDHLKTFDGLSTNQKLHILLKDGKIRQNDMITVEVEKQRLTKQKLSDLPIDWSKVTLMQRLYEDGFKIACVTNAIRETTNLILKKIGIIEYFDVIVSNDDVHKDARKPNTGPYVLAFYRLGLKPQECVAFEDSLKGLKSAIDSGCYTIEVRDAKQLTKDFVYSALNSISMKYLNGFNDQLRIDDYCLSK